MKGCLISLFLITTLNSQNWPALHSFLKFIVYQRKKIVLVDLPALPVQLLTGNGKPTHDFTNNYQCTWKIHPFLTV
ncbi:hypothetical protein PHET_07292 [Paragonimus heterotremus]|uniref:CUB domain-containing protein n=1 Tax=Paragonimus heterotremus TaxID=100268 RepID=A0A8J4TB37_9TREM|nr:hypothetical protein PHET_07292 [Paragonimus heterotremus]